MTATSNSGFLADKLLVAAPGMADPRFTKTVLYMCAHDQDHAMGIVINQPMHALVFGDLMRQLELGEASKVAASLPVLCGGPVEPERGFVLHSLDHKQDGETVTIAPGIGLSASKQILQAMASETPPKQCLLALGFANWGAGQIEMELEQNAWLICESDHDLIFDHDFESKWSRTMAMIGVDPVRFSTDAGHA